MTTALTPASFSRNNGHPVSDALHKSNRLPVCLPAGVGERSETAVSVAASCSLPLPVSPQPRLISAFQLSLILLLHCPLHKEFWANCTSALCYLCARVLTLCALVNSVPLCFSWESSVETVDLTSRGLWVNRYLLDFSVCVQCKQRRPRQRLPSFTQRAHQGAHRLHCLHLNLTQTNNLFSSLFGFLVFTSGVFNISQHKQEVLAGNNYYILHCSVAWFWFNTSRHFHFRAATFSVCSRALILNDSAPWCYVRLLSQVVRFQNQNNALSITFYRSLLSRSEPFVSPLCQFTKASNILTYVRERGEVSVST